jgi:starch-binding outer membrane protein, SusD/RagB family
MKKVFIVAACCLIIVASCEEGFLDNKLDNDNDLELVLSNHVFIRSLLYGAYLNLPAVQDHFGGNFLDAATDNAVSNQLNSGMNRMLEGRWSSNNDPVGDWKSLYEMIFRTNQFIEYGLNPEVVYSKSNPERNLAIHKLIKGEVYFLRAYYHFELLRKFSGKASNGELLGFPLVLENYSFENIPNLQRAPFADCVNQILTDCDIAFEQLEDQYSGPDPVTGDGSIGRPTKGAVLALKSRTLLYAASPAFTEDLTETQRLELWKKAALASIELINHLGKTLPNVYTVSGGTYTNYFNNPQNNEIIMRRMETSSSPESRSYPPSHYGQGRTNPSQNLVDAFGMSNGYPIDHPSSGFNQANPYAGRDQRLQMTVLYNGLSFKGRAIETFTGGIDMPGAPGVDATNSTRTGYYLRKWLSTVASRVPGNLRSDNHYYNLFRRVEAFLNFAEAANEAYGPDNDPDGLGYTAKQALQEVRRRALIPQPDNYLNEMAVSKEEFRKLVHNERRIELAFENHRFWDIRRWKYNLNEPIQGMRIERDPISGVLTYSKFTILTPDFKDHMYYGPIPFSEVVKSAQIIQNQGW